MLFYGIYDSKYACVATLLTELVKLISEPVPATAERQNYDESQSSSLQYCLILRTYRQA